MKYVFSGIGGECMNVPVDGLCDDVNSNNDLVSLKRKKCHVTHW
jgi:hypothetical protein